MSLSRLCAVMAVISAVAVAGGPRRSLTAVQAQGKGASQPMPCTDVDFLLGQWNVFNGQGQQVSDVTWIAGPGNCYVTETWKGRNGGKDWYCLMAYSHEQRNWSYLAASPMGARLRFENGKMQGEELRFDEMDVTDGTAHRFSYFKKPDGTLREGTAISTDVGKTWKDRPDLTWHRKK
jgi:hypothetical protein